MPHIVKVFQSNSVQVLFNLEANMLHIFFQTLLCISPPLFNINKMVFSETGAYLALIGQHGVCVVELPQKRGKFTQFEHGKEKINCRFLNFLLRCYVKSE